MGRSNKDDDEVTRPWIGADLRIGAALAVIIALKFAPPMMSARIVKTNGPIAPTLVNAGNAKPSDALTNLLPGSVAPATAKADEPPVLAAPVFEISEKIAPPLPDLPKAEAADPPKPASTKPVKLKPPDSIPDEPKKAPPIIFADAPKSIVESKKPGDGPIHPYFQRYLDQKEYFVRAGDTLESIAHRLFQDERKAADLLAANKDALPSATALKEGMTLKLP